MSLLPLTLACPKSLYGEKWTVPDVVPFTLESGTITVPRGKRFLLSLDSNPTTGYSWQIAGSQDALKLSDGSLEVTHCKYITKPHEKGMLGVGGNEIWALTVPQDARLGEASLPIKYVQPWMEDTYLTEEGAKDAKLIKVQVVENEQETSSGSSEN